MVHRAAPEALSPHVLGYLGYHERTGAGFRRLEVPSGATPVEGLAAEVGWSRRHLLARFREHTGLPPKVFARILRFQRAAALMTRSDGPSLCEIALDCGYYTRLTSTATSASSRGARRPSSWPRGCPRGGGYSG